MSYIETSAVISIQQDLTDPVSVAFPADLVLPDYKELIARGSLRRMSSMIRSGVWCGLSCSPDAQTPIVVGTGLGCLEDSIKFLKGIGPLESGDLPDMASPTPFIQSTHNAIAGQLALLTSNHGYNLTHVQDGHSFEAALIDALLLLEEGHDRVLVGGADEKTDLLVTIANKLGVPQDIINRFSGGAGFFGLTSGSGSVLIESCTVHRDINNISAAVANVNPDIVLFGNSGVAAFRPEDIEVPLFEYSDLCGIYMTNPVFGIELGRRVLCGLTAYANALAYSPTRLCVLNIYNNRSFGLITMSKA